MKLNSQMKTYLVLLGLAMGAVAANAQDGYWVTPDREAAIQPGMSKAEVAQVIGRPPRETSYGMAPGSTWVYGVAGDVATESSNRTVYEVDFNAQGQVVSARERVLLLNTNRGGSTSY